MTGMKTMKKESENVNETLLQTDKYYILDSASILLDEPTSPLYVPIIHRGETVGLFCLSFVTDEKERPSIEKKVESDILMITCVNFDDASGRFSLTPIQIATVNGKKICMQVKSSLNGSGELKLRTVQYTVLLEK